MWFVFRPQYLPKPDDETYESELRELAKAALMRFPETAALSPLELEAAVDRVISESKPETASVAAPGMDRFSDRKISIYLHMVEAPTVDDLLGADACGVFPLGWIEARRREMEEECRPEKKMPGQRLVLVDKIRVDLIAKGYVEFIKEYVDPDYDPDRPEQNNEESDGSDEEADNIDSQSDDSEEEADNVGLQYDSSEGKADNVDSQSDGCDEDGSYGHSEPEKVDCGHSELDGCDEEANYEHSE